MTVQPPAVVLMGYAAASLTTLSFIPQAIKTLRTGDTSGISLRMYALFTAGVALWGVYGLLTGDGPLIAANAITLVAEVIEAKAKPSQPWGQRRRTSFPTQLPLPQLPGAHGGELRVLVAIGEQDVDPRGLNPPDGVTIRGASSDHLVIGCGGPPAQVGDELRFGLSYSALLRAMTSPFVSRCLIHDRS